MENKNELKETLIPSQSKYEVEYKEKFALAFDYEINNLSGNVDDIFSFKVGEKQINLTTNKFDEIVEKYYRCKILPCYRRNWIKGMVSKNTIRFTNMKFDLDLM